MSQRASHTPIELPLNQPKPSRKTRKNSQKNGIDLLEVETMGDVVSSHEGSEQMGHGSSLTTVGSELEGVHSPLPGAWKDKHSVSDSSKNLIKMYL